MCDRSPPKWNDLSDKGAPPTVSIVHHDAKLSLLRFVHLLEPNYVRVVEDLQDLGLAECLLLFLLAHLLNVDLLDNC